MLWWACCLLLPAWHIPAHMGIQGKLPLIVTFSGIDLLSVFQAVPWLLEVIDSKDRLAQLQAINRPFCSWVHENVTKITIGPPGAIGAPPAPSRPSPELLISQHDRTKPKTILQIKHIIGKAPAFAVNKKRIDLVASIWPCLSELHCEGHVVHHAAIDMLQHGQWPSLKALHLSTQSLEANCLQNIVSYIPSLTKFFLSGVCCHVTELLHANWSQIQHLELCHMHLHRRVWPLARQTCPHLEVLSLHHSDLEVDDLREIAYGSWPNLRKSCTQQG